MEEKTKKRKSYGRMTDVAKKMRLCSHELGPDCKCKRLNCFSNVSDENKLRILRNFNSYSTYDEQNTYLAGLITVVPVKRRRPKNPEGGVKKFNDASYTFRVRCTDASDDQKLLDVQVCYKGFLALHGISGRRVQFIQNSLKFSGSSPKDKRGLHKNRPHKIRNSVIDDVCKHISSFKGRSSHYSTSKTAKTYLPEELNITKMYSMFKEKFPHRNLSYDSYKKVFNEKYNISFGYPRSDTCSQCDEINSQLKTLQSKIKICTDDNEVNSLNAQFRKLELDRKLHLTKAETFYQRKRQAKLSARAGVAVEAICMDFAKNLPIPNISTNDVYYSRQLSFYMFNIHVLSSQQSVFYGYPETVGQKGSNNVCSLLHHFLYNYLDANVKSLKIFADSCGGQNKNYTVFRFLHHVVHYEKRLEDVHITFPIRGHSYLECDKDFGMINQKTRTELPNDWFETIRASRVKPQPFDVDEVPQKYFRSWDKHLNPLYKKKCPFPSRPIRELKISVQHPRLVYYRVTYNGAWESVDIIGKPFSTNNTMEFRLPDYLYTGLIPLSIEKYRDLTKLTKFCGERAQNFLLNLPYKKSSNQGIKKVVAGIKTTAKTNKKAVKRLQKVAKGTQQAAKENKEQTEKKTKK